MKNNVIVLSLTISQIISAQRYSPEVVYGFDYGTVPVAVDRQGIQPAA